MAHASARLRWSRVTLACAAALVVCLAAGTSALADSKSGVRGHSAIADTTSHPAVTCNYTPNYPNHYLVSVSVRAPSLWWPNLSSSNHHEHGTVGWLPAVQRQSHGAWQTVASGTLQQAVAYEDRPLHDPADKAPLTNQSIPRSDSEPTAYRVTITATWYAANNSVMGKRKHVATHYRMTYPGYSGKGTGTCPGRITILG